MNILSKLIKDCLNESGFTTITINRANGRYTIWNDDRGYCVNFTPNKKRGRMRLLFTEKSIEKALRYVLTDSDN